MNMGYNDGYLLTYSKCEELMAKARNPANGKPIKNNTRLFRHDGGKTYIYFTLRLHNTDIITICPQGWELNAGGWRTVTTKHRLNNYGPVGVSQVNFEWFIGTHDGDVPFHDGIFIDRKHRQAWCSWKQYMLRPKIKHDFTLEERMIRWDLQREGVVA
jgi:hypothetical protein